MSGEAVAQRVGESSNALADHPPQSPGAEGAASGPNPEMVPGESLDKQRASMVEVVLECGLSGSADRHLAPFASFANNGDDISADIIDRERRKLGNSEPGRVEKLDDGGIPRTDRLGSVDALDRGNEVPGWNGMGKRTVQLGTGNGFEGVDAQLTTAAGIDIETRYRRGFTRDRASRIFSGVEERQVATGVFAPNISNRVLAGPATEVEELGEIATVCIDCVRREAALVAQPGQVSVDRGCRPIRDLGKVHISMVLEIRRCNGLPGV